MRFQLRAVVLTVWRGPRRGPLPGASGERCGRSFVQPRHPPDPVANVLRLPRVRRQARKADLRLDVPESARWPSAREPSRSSRGTPSRASSGCGSMPRIPAKMMPPPSSRKQLTAEQKATPAPLDRAGAPLPEALGLRTAAAIAEPAVADTAWARGPVDRFILARLEEQGLKPQPEADKETLIRRVAFALTGLPPTVAEVDAVPGRPLARRVRKDGRPLSGVAAIRRGDGPALARRGPLCRHARLAPRQRAPDVGLSRLGGRGVQPQPAVRPIHDRATGRRSAAECHARRSSSPPVSTAAMSRPAKGVRSRRNSSSAMPSIARARWPQTWMGAHRPAAPSATTTSSTPSRTREFYSMYAFFNRAADPGMDGNVIAHRPVREAARRRRGRADACARRRRQAEENRRAQLANSRYADPADCQNPASAAACREQPIFETVWMDDAFPAGCAPCGNTGPQRPRIGSTGRVGHVFSGQRVLRQHGQRHCHKILIERPLRRWRSRPTADCSPTSISSPKVLPQRDHAAIPHRGLEASGRVGRLRRHRSTARPCQARRGVHGPAADAGQMGAAGSAGRKARAERRAIRSPASPSRNSAAPCIGTS